MKTADPLLQAVELSKTFAGRRVLGGRTAPVLAVRGVNLEIRPGEIVGLAGESGSGKSTLASILAALEEPSEGNVFYKGEVVHELTGAARREYQRKVQFVFQDPFDALSNRFTVEHCIEEPLVVQRMAKRGTSRSKVAKAMSAVGLTPPDEYMTKLPWQLSGGQRQRVAIARSLITDPSLIIADEPVSMLDVSMRAGVLDILARLREQFSVSVLYISHDLSTIRQVCDRVLVMWRGQIVEGGLTRQVLEHPTHSYTKSLLSALPRLDETYLEVI